MEAPACPPSPGAQQPGRPELPEEMLVDESFLLQALRDVVNRHILPSGKGDLEAPPEDLDGRLETLWDLCVDVRAAAFLAGSNAIAVFSEAAARAESAGEVRCTEVCLGVLANVCAHREVVAGLGAGDVAALPS